MHGPTLVGGRACIHLQFMIIGSSTVVLVNASSGPLSSVSGLVGFRNRGSGSILHFVAVMYLVIYLICLLIHIAN